MLGIERYSSRNSTQPRFLISCGCSTISDAQLFTILRPQSSEREIALLLGQLERGEHLLITAKPADRPRIQALSAAEEAARFLHHACQGLPRNPPSRIGISFTLMQSSTHWPISAPEFYVGAVRAMRGIYPGALDLRICRLPAGRSVI